MRTPRGEVTLLAFEVIEITHRVYWIVACPIMAPGLRKASARRAT